MIKVVSFDVGNTLVKFYREKSLAELISDKTGISHEVINKELKNYLTQDFSTKKEFVMSLASKMDLDYHCIALLIEQYTVTAYIYPDVIECMKYLSSKGYLIISVSNALSFNIIDLNELGLVDITYQFYSSRCGLKKPDILFYKYIEKCVSAYPNEIIHIGDSIRCDVNGAKAAGWDSIYLNRNKEKSYEEKEINTLTELKKFL